MRHVIAIAAAAVLAGGIAPALAETGDYSRGQTLANLFSPPPADRPVTAAERSAAQYPLLANPDGFADGFVPGDYLKWQTIQLHPDSGAICGNGSPYKFFLSRAASTSNTVIYFEGGGACWDYPSCTGAEGIRGARNPDGIPDNYLDISNPSASLVSPFVFRAHPYSEVKTQRWNVVYVPYCTGDVYSGDSVAVYEDPAGVKEPLVWRHNGVRNVRAILSWLRDNIQQPGQFLATGCSAGGAGSINNYHHLRRDLAAQKNFLIDDSGPIFDAPVGASDADYPSARLHAQIKSAWGLAAFIDYARGDLPGLIIDNLGSLNRALAEKYPNDRLGVTFFQQDLNYSAYSYERFYDDIVNAPNDRLKEKRILARWAKDTARLKATLDALPNYGGYFPYFRDFNDSHCTTIVDFNNGDVQERGLELSDFISSVLDGSGPVLDALEEDEEVDRAKPLNLLYFLIEQLL
ncbi:MAG: pectin acetylesterase-family hydrolase [Parvularculaceae bacterium]